MDIVTAFAPTGLTAPTVPDGSVTLAKLADLANATVIGRDTSGTGVPEAMTMAQLQTKLATAGGWVQNTGSGVQDIATSLTMSGTGQDYEFRGVIFTTNATVTYHLQPNSLGTNQEIWRFGNATSGAYVNNHSDLRIGSVSATATIWFNGRIHQVTGVERIFTIDIYQVEGGTLIASRGIGRWAVTTEITGFRIHASTSNGFAAGSLLEVRRV